MLDVFVVGAEERFGAFIGDGDLTNDRGWRYGLLSFSAAD
jgi:hypothetical protein